MNQDADRTGDAARDAEWRRQERARELERGAPGHAADTARVQRYRQVVRALDQPPEPALPSNFAHAASLEIARRLAQHRRQDQAFARRLRGGLLVGYLGGLLAAAWLFRPAWQPVLSSLMTPERLLNPWLLATSACLALSWLAARHRSRPRH